MKEKEPEFTEVEGDAFFLLLENSKSHWMGVYLEAQKNIYELDALRIRALRAEIDGQKVTFLVTEQGGLAVNMRVKNKMGFK